MAMDYQLKKHMKKIRAIVFDFDGTLTPLTLNFVHLRTEILKIAEQYATKDVLKDLKGLEGFLVIEMIYAIDDALYNHEGSQEFKNKAFERLRELEVEAAVGKDLFPYTRKTLKSLKDRSIKTGIITRSCLDVLKTVFPDIFDYIDNVVTRDDIKHVKPHVDHVNKILKMMDIPGENTLTVGDHPTDIMAGKAAGTYTAGVLTGRTLKDAFEGVGATYVLNDISEILMLETLK